MADKYIQTPYGIFGGVAASSSYPDGTLREVILEEKNMLLTHAGELVPFYTVDSPRRKRKSSVGFHPNGMVKSVSLQEQQDIQTPIGEFPAELVTFYDTGELKRFFVLDGQISGFWTEEDERNLNIPFTFDFGFARFSAMLNGVCFYKSGDVKSVGLFPGETIAVTTERYGKAAVRYGFSLYEDGKLRSFEPASPWLVATPVGRIGAFDVDAVGVHADSGSVMLDPEGRIVRAAVSFDRIVATPKDGPMEQLAPRLVPSPLDPEKTALVPLRLRFDYDAGAVAVGDGEKEHVFPLEGTGFAVLRGAAQGCAPGECASCSLGAPKHPE